MCGQLGIDLENKNEENNEEYLILDKTLSEYMKIKEYHNEIEELCNYEKEYLGLVKYLCNKILNILEKYDIVMTIEISKDILNGFCLKGHVNIIKYLYYSKIKAPFYEKFIKTGIKNNNKELVDFGCSIIFPNKKLYEMPEYIKKYYKKDNKIYF